MPFQQVMLGFLENVVEDSCGLPLNNEDVKTTIQDTVERAVELYSGNLDCLYDDFTPLLEEDFLVSLPEGVVVYFLKLFYDSYLYVNVPSIFLSSGTGFHLCRVTPSLSDDATATSHQHSTSSRANGYGVSLHCFSVDCDSQFGGDGLALSILGSGRSDGDEEFRREPETIVDVVCGECEVLFHPAVACSFVGLFKLLSLAPTTAPSTEKPSECAVSRLFTAERFSVSLFAGDFAPFSRVVAGHSMVRSNANEEEKILVLSRSLDLVDLTPAGELLPQALSTLETGPAFQLTMFENSTRLLLDGLQIILLRRFLNELLQYFTASDSGVSSLHRQMFSTKKHSRTSSTMSMSVSISNSVLLLPRSSTNLDCVAFEIESLVLETTTTEQTFQMPTRKHPVLVRNVATGKADDVARLCIKLHGIRIFSAQLNVDDSGKPVTDNPSFRFFYSISGRPVAGGTVYQSRRADERLDTPEYDLDSRRAAVRWCELSADGPVDLEVLVDYAPHLRILFCDPVDRPPTGLSLRLDERQYALVLSVWYCNMQELPMMFPFSAHQLYEGSGQTNKLNSERIPTFGAEPMRTFLCASTATVTSEIAISLRKLSINMLLIDVPTENSGDRLSDQEISLSLTGPCIHILSDDMCQTKVASGCSAARLSDHSQFYPNVLNVGNNEATLGSWADFLFGLDCDFKILQKGLPQPLQLCVTMTPAWKLYTLGLDSPVITLVDLDPVLKLLSWFSCYFANDRLGNPCFDANATVEKIRQELHGVNGLDGPSSQIDCSGTDFRLWMANPQLNIPCDPSATNCSIVRVTAACGLWYKFLTHGSVTFHECASDSMELVFQKHCGQEATVIKHLSLGVRFVLFQESRHSDLNVQVPFVDFERCVTDEIAVSLSPNVVADPVICLATETAKRILGGNACEVTMVAETCFAATTALMGFLGVKTDIEDDQSHSTSSSCSYILSVYDTRVFTLDPQLGEHLPFIVLNVSALDVTSSDVSPVHKAAERSQTDLQVICRTTLWADYFKRGPSRSWEPLLEATSVALNFERSQSRGTGITLTCSSDLHFNITSAFLVGVDDIVHCYNLFARGSVQTRNDTDQAETTRRRASVVESCFDKEIVHEIPRALSNTSRVAFSLMNKTGETLRTHGHELRSDDGPTVLSYLDHNQVTDLFFLPSVSVVRNLRIADVPYPGISTSLSSEKVRSLTQNTLSIQVAGYTWNHAINVSGQQIGCRFVKLTPTDPQVLFKIEQNWKLANALALLVEVGQHGGQQVTVQSVFTLCNRTDYALSIEISPWEDVKSSVHEGVLVEPGDWFHVPPLLLNMSLKKREQLGFVFIQPNLSTDDIETLFPADIRGESLSPDTKIGRCSKPISLNELVEESAAMFSESRGVDISPNNAVTGAQLSCPFAKSGKGLMSPFFLTVEIRRSPIVRAEHTSAQYGATIHGPVEYALSVFAPIVVTNLLPKRAKFELMHAIRRQVIWYAELDPGEHASAHSIGLDAPLLLFVNLSFARTPVGEGVLVHHGSDTAESARCTLLMNSTCFPQYICFVIR
jgi:hypothetical protein